MPVRVEAMPWLFPCKHRFHDMTMRFQQYFLPLYYADTLLIKNMIDSARSLALDKFIHANPLPPP